MSRKIDSKYAFHVSGQLLLSLTSLSLFISTSGSKNQKIVWIELHSSIKIEEKFTLFAYCTFCSTQAFHQRNCESQNEKSKKNWRMELRFYLFMIKMNTYSILYNCSSCTKTLSSCLPNPTYMCRSMSLVIVIENADVLWVAEINDFSLRCLSEVLHDHDGDDILQNYFYLFYWLTESSAFTEQCSEFFLQSSFDRTKIHMTFVFTVDIFLVFIRDHFYQSCCSIKSEILPL